MKSTIAPYPVLLLLLQLAACTANKKESTYVAMPDRSTGTRTDSVSPIPALSLPDTVAFNMSVSDFELDSFPIRLSNGLAFKVAVLKGYKIGVAADGLNRLRFLALSPDKRLFATDMYDRSDNRKGRVLLFEDWDEHTHRFGSIRTFIGQLHNPNQLAFFGNHIYIAETDKLTRYSYHKDDTAARGKGEVIARFPDYGLSYKYGGWHLTRSLAFNNNKLYVSVGSSCNACIEKEAIRASILEMNPDGSDSRIFARGLRNSVGIKWIGPELWATGMGRDLIGPDRPEDLFQQIKEGGYYGWPYYYQYRNKIFADEQFLDSARPAYVQEPPLALTGFRAHSAPLGFEFFRDFEDPLLHNSVLVCLHGSTSAWRQRGNAIVRLEKGNRYAEVVAGFLKGKTEAGRYGRPCDILMYNNRSFFFTDDLNGVLYYVWK